MPSRSSSPPAPPPWPRSPRASPARATTRWSSCCSGGNVDPLLLNRIIQSGLYEEGRYLVATTKLSDRPGNLVKLLSIVAERRANVLAVEHHRLDTSLGVTEVTVRLELETRGPDHIRELCEALAEGGYPLEAELPATVTAG